MGAGTVQRFHTVSRGYVQNVAEHTYNVLSLVMVLTEYQPSPGLVLAALLHDVPEIVTGDLPAPTKRRLYAYTAPQRSYLERFETEIMEEAGFPMHLADLSEEENRILKVADTIDGFRTALNLVISGNYQAVPVMKKYREYLDELGLSGLEQEVLEQVAKQEGYTHG